MLDAAPLVLGLASAFAEVQQEKNQEVMSKYLIQLEFKPKCCQVLGTFVSSFMCDFSCKNEGNLEKRVGCEKKYCGQDGPEPQEDVENEASTVLRKFLMYFPFCNFYLSYKCQKLLLQS